MGAALDLSEVDLSHLPLRAQRSQPTVTGFCPDGIPYQRRVMKLVRKEFDYSAGNLEILLSGAYGSAKSVLLAHLATSHAMMNRRACVAIVRRSLPDIKATIFKEIVNHLRDDRKFKEGRDYWVNAQLATVRFKNGSEIKSVYWGDRRYKRVRSLSLSMVIIEEAVENDEQDREGFMEIKSRLRRIKGVRENVLIAATNPDSPAHWLYEYFIKENSGGKVHKTRRVFYSVTKDNPYLPPIYTKQLLEDLDPRAILRYVHGQWIELTKDRVYYAYDTDLNYRPWKYKFRMDLPIYVSWDFNIGHGKPLSLCVAQHDTDDGGSVFHVAKDICVEGMRTDDSLEALADSGILDLDVPLFVFTGDAAGKHKDTRNIRDDWEIIEKFFANYRRTTDGRAINWERAVPLSNPPVRERHNQVNGQCLNGLGDRRLFVYEDAPMVHKGLRLVQLKKGSDIVEDDSKDYQHVTTALGYMINTAKIRRQNSNTPQGTREL